MYSLCVKLSQVVGRNTVFHKENPRKGDLEDFRALPSFTGIRMTSLLPRKTKETGTRDPQNLPSPAGTWAHAQATVGPQLLMLNGGTGVFLKL